MFGGYGCENIEVHLTSMWEAAGHNPDINLTSPSALT